MLTYNSFDECLAKIAKLCKLHHFQATKYIVYTNIIIFSLTKIWNIKSRSNFSLSCEQLCQIQKIVFSKNALGTKWKRISVSVVRSFQEIAYRIGLAKKWPKVIDLKYVQPSVPICHCTDSLLPIHHLFCACFLLVHNKLFTWTVSGTTEDLNYKIMQQPMFLALT